MSASPAPPPQRRDRAVALGLGLFCLALYLLTFAGQFRSIDELALYAAAESLAQTGRPGLDLIRFAAYHNFINAFEPGQSALAAPLVWLARRAPEVSNLHAALLLNPVITALNAAALYGLGRRLGYAVRPALGLAGAFALGTLAWPYAKSFLREPAVGLLWTLSLGGLLRFAERPTGRAAAAAVAAAAAALAFKFAAVVALPVAALGLAWPLYRARRVPLAWLLAGGGLLLAGLAAAALLVFNLRGYPLSALLGNFTANPFSREGITPWYGLLFSPGKGLFVFAPVTALAVLGWPGFFHRHRLPAVLVVVWTLAMLAALRASGWWGGLAWGPRYLLPLVPVLMLPALEALARWRWAWALAALSVLLQALVAAANWSVGYAGLFERYPNPDTSLGLDWTRWAETPLFRLLQRWGPGAWDLVWLRAGPNGEVNFDLPLGLGLGLAVVVTGAALAWLLRGGRARPALAAGGLAAAAAIPLLLWRGYWNLPDYGGLPADLARSLAREVSGGPYAPERLVNVSADFGVYPWLGLLKGPARAAWISPLEEEPGAVLTPGSGERLAVVMDWTHLWGHAPQATLAWLNANAYRFAGGWREGLEVYYYSLEAEPEQKLPAAAVWPLGVTLTEVRVPRAFGRGDALPVALRLRCEADPCDTTTALFVNLLGPDGVVLAGGDNPVQFGALTPGRWRAGQTVVDRRGVWIPPDAPPGEYELLAGFVNAEGFVPVTGAGGETAPYATLTRVVIGAP